MKTNFGASLMILGAIFSGLACSAPTHAADLPQPAVDLAPPAEGETTRTAVFGAGCFWCVETVFERINGVSDVLSGYAGDSKDTADYETVCTGKTKHAEVVQITYDPRVTTYGKLLRIFFATHDPTTLNRQGPDSGPQYRSAVFYANDDEKRVAEAYIGQLTDAKVYAKPIVTTVEPLGAGFFEAEDYHQDFARLNPAYPYIRRWVPEKLQKLEKATAAPSQPQQAATPPAEAKP